MFIPIQKSKGEFSRETVAKMILRKSAPRIIQKFNPNHDEKGRFGTGSGVVFEVAPNPDTRSAADKWNALSDQEKFSRSQQVQAEYIPKILADRGIKGGVVSTQYGSYQDDTNTSFNLQLPEGALAQDVIDATRGIGFNFSQKSMIAIDTNPFPGSEPVDSVEITAPKEFTLQSTKDLYTQLRTLEVGGKKAVGGATTVGRTMAVLNFDKVMDTPALVQAIKDKITEPGWEVHAYQVHSWFATEADYGTGHETGLPSTGGQQGEHFQPAHSDFRAAVTAAVTKILGWLKGNVETIAAQQNWPTADDFVKGGLGSGRYPAGSGQGNLIAPAKASPQESKSIISSSGPYQNMVSWFSKTKGADLTPNQAHQIHTMAQKEIKNSIKPALNNLKSELNKIGIDPVIKTRPKEEDSLLGKAHGKWADRTADAMTDSIGARITFQNQEEVDKAIPILTRGLGMKALEHDDFHEEGKSGGYRAQHFLFQSQHGITFEVQVQTPWQRTFQGFAHDIYKPEHKFGIMSVREKEQGMAYSQKVGDWIHNYMTGKDPGPKPVVPQWIHDRNADFPWEKLKERIY